MKSNALFISAIALAFIASGGALNANDDCPSAQAIYYDMSEYTGGFAYNLKPEEIASSRVASLLS
ncbi:MAG: hypothetical protein LBC09_01635, partial [Helicobacteraceae bacterium]|nr:hypothetical protein [Helicobacteraceae bacterium]